LVIWTCLEFGALNLGFIEMGSYFYQFVLFLNSLLFNNFGLTIIALAILSRAIFFPMFSSQIKQAKKWEELKPKFDGLSKKLKNDEQKLAMEQAKLMREAGVNPAAGCLPLILQILIINLLYGAFFRFIKEGLNTKFLIWDLAKPDIIKLNLGENPLALPGILVILAAATQFIQTKMMTGQRKDAKEKEAQKAVEEQEGIAGSFAQSQEMMVWMFPLMFLFLGTKWPGGLALYWSVATIIAIGQQWYLGKRK